MRTGRRVGPKQTGVEQVRSGRLVREAEGRVSGALAAAAALEGED